MIAQTFGQENPEHKKELESNDFPKKLNKEKPTQEDKNISEDQTLKESNTEYQYLSSGEPLHKMNAIKDHKINKHIHQENEDENNFNLNKPTENLTYEKAKMVAATKSPEQIQATNK